MALGTVTVTDYVMLKAMKKADFRPTVINVIPHLSKIITVCLIALYATGLLLLTQKIGLLSSPVFQTKLGLVLLLTVNGFWLNLRISPAIRKLWGANAQARIPKPLLWQARLSGAISVVSWWGAFFMAIYF